MIIAGFPSHTVITTRALRLVTVAYCFLALPFRIAFANFYAQGLGGSRLQQWDRNVLVSIRMGNLSNLGFALPLLTGPLEVWLHPTTLALADRIEVLAPVPTGIGTGSAPKTATLLGKRVQYKGQHVP
ncbi:hypothetical protein F5888DRAFT_1800480 [Russula emetica]|nr:hypothetical protein F5888DRAFT_1800480 [Russula emetica]